VDLRRGYVTADAGPAAAADAATIVIMDASVSAAFVIRLTATLLQVSPPRPSWPPDEMELDADGPDLLEKARSPAVPFSRVLIAEAG
jgi:hypothetical protein